MDMDAHAQHRSEEGRENLFKVVFRGRRSPPSHCSRDQVRERTASREKSDIVTATVQICHKNDCLL